MTQTPPDPPGPAPPLSTLPETPPAAPLPIPAAPDAPVDGSGITPFERGLFVAGFFLTGLLVAELAAIWAADSELAARVVGALAAELVLGREGGIPVGLVSGVPAWLLFQVSVTQDLALGFLAYPAALVALHRLERRRARVHAWLVRLRERAQRHHGVVRRWGPLGVFAFMLLPFLVNGPLVAGITGRLAGLRTRLLVPPIVLATTVAALLWTFFLREAMELTERLRSGLGVALLVGLVAAATLLAVRPLLRRAPAT